MVNRFGKWWLLWMTLIVVWSVVVFAFAWMNLPRAHSVPHEPQFLARMSAAASSILRGPAAAKNPARGALVWSESPRFLRMSNGVGLTLPGNTTGEQAAFVAREYHSLLNDEARARRWSYLLTMLAVWLVPCGGLLAAAMAARPLRAVLTPAGFPAPIIPHYVRQRTEKAAAEGDTVSYARASQNPAAEYAAETKTDFACAA